VRVPCSHSVESGSLKFIVLDHEEIRPKGVSSAWPVHSLRLIREANHCVVNGPEASTDFSPALRALDVEFRHVAFGNHCVHRSYKRQFSSFSVDLSS